MTRIDQIASKITESSVSIIAARVAIPPYPGRRKAIVEESLEAVYVALEAKEIWNVDFKKLKENLGGAYSTSESEIRNALKDAMGWDKMPHEQRSETYDGTHPLHEIPMYMLGMRKYLRLLKKYKGPMEDELTEWAEGWWSVWELLVSLKPFVQKGRKPDPNAKPKNVYVAPSVSTNGLKMVKDALEKVVAQMAGKMAGRMAERYIKGAEAFIEGREPKEDPYNFYKGDPEMRNAVAKLVVRTEGADWRGSIKKYEISRDAKGTALRISERVVKEVVERYVFKNINKIGSVVERKGGLKSIGIRYGTLQGWGFSGEFDCEFVDGTSFAVRNKVVYKWSRSGGFAQFPTTFHQVVWPDGKRSAMVPEKQMNEEWAKS